MNKVYCNFITPTIRQQAHRLGINPSILNNIISTMKSVNNNPNIDTSDNAINTFINNNKDRMKELKLSLPYYKSIPLSTNYNKLTSTIMGSITIRTFNDNFPSSDWINHIYKSEFMLNNLDLFDSPRAIYTYELYLEKLCIENNVDLSKLSPTERNKYIDSAIRALKEVKETYPDEFEVKINTINIKDGNSNVNVEYKIVSNIKGGKFATIKGNTISIREAVSTNEIRHYLAGDTDEFRKKVMQNLKNRGYNTSSIYKAMEDKNNIAKFLISSMYSHLKNNDAATYNKLDENGKLDIETRATEDGLNSIGIYPKTISTSVQEYSNEEQSIINKAKKNGTFMKAPNGKPTNLTEKQWVQVRTKAFKDWFGDWERIFKQNKYKPINSNNVFKHSLFRGQAPIPEIDKDGNLHLKTSYDSLSKLKTLSFALKKEEALHYGYRVAKNPYIIELNEDYLDSILPNEEYERDKVENKKPFRYNEEFNEVRLSFNDEIIIPKGQYSISQNEGSININNVEDAKIEIFDLINLMFLSDAQEYNGVSELEGAISKQDIEERYIKIEEIIGEKFYDIISISEASKDHKGRSNYYNNKNIQKYINEGYLIEKDYDSFTEEDLKTLPSKAIEQIKKEWAYYELTDKANKEINKIIKENKKNNSTTVQENSNEKKSIIDKAKKNGTFMKAPNGKPTNLTEKQWVQVRTKAFKDWFGDWENDPKNASKVVDENGEPLVVYHNSNADINIFDKNKIGTNGSSEGGLFGEGFYFSTNKDYNNIFGNKEYAVFLNIKNPITDERTIKEIQAFRPSIDTIKSAYNKDGLIGINESENNTVEYVAYDSNQIKSAINNTGAFSKDSNDIYDTDSKETLVQKTTEKQDTTSTQEEAPIQEDDKSYAEDLARCARQMSPI